MQTVMETHQGLAEREYRDFKRMSKDDRFEICQGPRFLKELVPKTDKPYILHTAWAARILAGLCPEKHIDISSSIYFNTLVSAFIPIEFYDYCPLIIPLSGLLIKYADLTELPFSDNSIHSLSCMHVVEHIGLGRYGEPIDPEGDLKAISELKRVLAGDLLFVVPVGGIPMVVFNLHRIYSYEQIISYFEGLKLVEFVLIPDKTEGDFVKDAELVKEQYCGCGCFWFRKERK